jgi:hypothetical protein
MDSRRWLLLQILAAVPALAALPVRADELKVGEPAPAATLVTLDDQTLATQALRAAKS